MKINQITTNIGEITMRINEITTQINEITIESTYRLRLFKSIVEMKKNKNESAKRRILKFIVFDLISFIVII